jgi:hypothetical protein
MTITAVQTRSFSQLCRAERTEAVALRPDTPVLHWPQRGCRPTPNRCLVLIHAVSRSASGSCKIHRPGNCAAENLPGPFKTHSSGVWAAA